MLHVLILATFYFPEFFVSDILFWGTFICFGGILVDVDTCPVIGSKT